MTSDAPIRRRPKPVPKKLRGSAAPPKPKPAPPKKTKHRRTVFCPETCATILRWLELGNFRESACARARVDPRTLSDWLKRGADEHEKAAPDEELTEYAAFYLDVISAEATAETILVGQVLEGEPEDKRWFLERRYPKRFGRMATRVEVTGEDGKPIEVQDARRTLLGRLLQVVGSGAAQADDPVAEPG